MIQTTTPQCMQEIMYSSVTFHEPQQDIATQARNFSQGHFYAPSYEKFKEILTNTKPPNKFSGKDENNTPPDIAEYFNTLGEEELQKAYATREAAFQEKIAAGPLPDPPRRVIVRGIPRKVTQIHELNRQYAVYKGRGLYASSTEKSHGFYRRKLFWTS